MKEVSETFSTTQLAGSLTIGLTVYNLVAKNSDLISNFSATPNEIMALATLAAPIVTCGYMMWRRLQKSDLFLGFLK